MIKEVFVNYCRVRREKPRYTAARECFEETLGILGTTEELAEALKDFKTNNCFKVYTYILVLCMCVYMIHVIE